ncbi:glycosyltransferase involved in cell wall biosynthesis [Gracilibacillus halotolerans]|uniref:Glycosyltransferase involved in cell wall biosynthesis n=1 Tax=Gracilibacillus halotolerans TaxID=74386 RepID=A0A841RNJ9_9BACI|nr:glycosyltransferase family 1 protein [Gracilibacillus halotolerans]MBB6514421.1 glycosyltransferase involved in cell wall biosynthesis [Gracilibacillus halotolerans]
MRIAIFSDTYVPEINGVALTLQRYTDYLRRQGIEYRLFVPSTSTAVPQVPQIERLTSIPFLLYRDLRFSLPNPLQINQVLDTFKPTLIHIATPFNIGLSGLLYGKKHQIPMIASYHTHFDHYLNYYHLSFLNKWVWKYLDWFHRPFERIYVPSESTKHQLLTKKFHRDIRIWGRGVDHDFFTPTKRVSHYLQQKYGIKENKILLYVGRMAPEKNIEFVLDMFHSLPSDVKKDTHLVMVGDGPLYSMLSQTYREKITWTGFLEGEELAKAYASSDIFLFPSETETFGNVVLEALASGLPVIGANAGGVGNIIKDGKTGFLCEPRNREVFVKQTEKLLENNLLRKNFADEARKYACTQSWDTIFRQLVANLIEVSDRKRISVIA